MKVAILAGGKGTRLAGNGAMRPKCLTEIGDRPLLWHIARYYEHFGFSDLVVALGHRGGAVREWLAEHLSSAGPNRLEGRIDLVDTGEDTATGGRIRRLAPHLGGETFMLTWCDGLSDLDLRQLLAFHRSHGRLATVTAVHPPPRFGRLALDGARVVRYREKPRDRDEWVSGAYFVLEPGVIDYIAGDDTQWEAEPLERLAAEGELMAYRHEGFWDCLDTPADHERLEALWSAGDRPWALWERRA